jgi:hypothetical protein
MMLGWSHHASEFLKRKMATGNLMVVCYSQVWYLWQFLNLELVEASLGSGAKKDS